MIALLLVAVTLLCTVSNPNGLSLFSFLAVFGGGDGGDY